MSVRRMKRLLGQHQPLSYYYCLSTTTTIRTSTCCRSLSHCNDHHRHDRWATTSTASSTIARRYFSTYLASGDSRSGENTTNNVTTTGGVVEGVWIFCRHGDRVPSRCLSPAHRREEEAAFWMSKLPRPDSAAAFESFSTIFPLDIHPGFNQGKFIDVARNPFGFLTQQGVEQLNDMGHKFFDRYNKHGHHFADQKEWRWGVAQDFLSVWDVHVFSTNYLRTVMSVQSFLDGLLGTHLLLKDAPQRIYDPLIRREVRLPDHSWGRSSRNKNIEQEALVKVQVRDTSNDPLNAFDRNPDLIADLTAQVMQSPEFQRRDTNAATLAARLAIALPGLVRRRSTAATGVTADFATRSPSGINWVEAADHFVCRMAHNIEFGAFANATSDQESALAAMATPVLTHLAWRFRQWYQNKRLLAVIAAPPLREVARHVVAAAQLPGDGGSRSKHPFVIYSCHDITILGLLYGIGADFLADDERSGWRFWPGYGSTLTFELVRIREAATKTTRITTQVDEHNNSSNQVDNDSHVVRILLNGRPVLTAQAHKNEKGRTKLVYPGNGPEHMLQVSDFLDTVQRLEDEGGFDYDSLLGLK